MEEWRRLYTWTAYVQPHFRYGALLYNEDKQEMIKTHSRYNRFRRMYNKTLKDCLGLPIYVPHAKIDKLLGV